MEAEDNNKTDNILEMALLVVPVIMFPQLGELINANIPTLAMSAILGGLGGMIGFLLMWLLKEKKTSIKISAIVAMFLLFIGATNSLTGGTESAKRDLMSCDICGYKAVPAAGAACEVCFIPLTEEFRMEEGYTSIAEMILEEQFLFFGLEEEVEVYQPAIYDDGELKYDKDPDWSPQFTADQFDAWMKELEEIEEKLDIEVITE